MSQENTLDSEILEHIRVKLSEGIGLLMPELDELNDKFATDSKEYLCLEMPNKAGHKTPFFVWRFRPHIYHSLIRLTQRGDITVRIVTTPSLFALSLPIFPNRPTLLTNLKQAENKEQHWVLLSVVLGKDPEGGHWDYPRKEDKSISRFNWYNV